MAHANISDEECPILCPRCQADATWHYSDQEKTIVEVFCCDCGPFEMPRAEFERAESDIAEPREPG